MNKTPNTYSKQQPQQAQNHASPQNGGSDAGEAQIPIDGYQQVLEMLKIADPAFRESLLARLAQRDQQLARTLRAHLADL